MYISQFIHLPFPPWYPWICSLHLCLYYCFINKIIYTNFFRFHICVQFSHSVLFDSLRPHELQHATPPCPSPTLRVHPNPCPSSRWCHPFISSSVVPFSSCPQSFPASGSFPMSQLFAIRWPKYWSFSFNISPSDEHLGWISFRMDWLDLLAVQGTLKSLLQFVFLCLTYFTLFNSL